VQENQNDINLKKNPSVLITGGRGLVGKYLTSILLSRGYKVSHLSRNTNQFSNVRVFRWNPEKRVIDPKIFKDIDYLIHLAGANIGEKRWTKKRKQEIVNSRVDSARFLYKVIAENRIPLQAFISASAIGYYGSLTTNKIFIEEDPPENDFLGNTCRLWEAAADLFKNTGIRTVKIRTSIVLEKDNSVFSKLSKPAKFGFIVRTGSGQQYMPWIHVTDLCNIYIKAIEDKNMKGAYNAVSPQHLTHNDFMRIFSRIIKRRIFLPPIPEFVLKTALGEMSDLILKGSRISSNKITEAGYNFHFDNLEKAIKDLINQ
jgi:uncharacterized protein